MKGCMKIHIYIYVYLYTYIYIHIDISYKCYPSATDYPSATEGGNTQTLALMAFAYLGSFNAEANTSQSLYPCKGVMVPSLRYMEGRWKV